MAPLRMLCARFRVFLLTEVHSDEEEKQAREALKTAGFGSNPNVSSLIMIWDTEGGNERQRIRSLVTELLAFSRLVTFFRSTHKCTHMHTADAVLRGIVEHCTYGAAG